MQTNDAAPYLCSFVSLWCVFDVAISNPIASTKCESGEPPTIYFVGAFFVLTMLLSER